MMMDYAAVSSTTGTSSGGSVYVVVSGFAPPVSVHPAPRIVRRRIAVVRIMVVLVDCMVFSRCCEYLRVVVYCYGPARWGVGIDRL